MSLVWLDGTRVTPEERDEYASRLPARRSLLGRIFGPWAVVERVGTRRVLGGTNPVWRVIAVCCAREAIATSVMLSVYAAPSRRDAVTGLCRRCRKAPVRDTGCRWCPRPSVATARALRGKRRKGVTYECGACNRRALRNGRDAEGRPIYKSSAQTRAGRTPA